MTTTRDKIEELKRQIEVMEGYERGEVCQIKLSPVGDVWVDIGSPAFSVPPTWKFDTFDFRIKPKKREVWIPVSIIPEKDRTSISPGHMHLFGWDPKHENFVRFVEAD